MCLFLSFLILLTGVSANPLFKTYQEYFLEGDQALLAGDFDKAIACYLQGVFYAKPRESVIVKDDLGYAYLRLGKLDKAKDERFSSGIAERVLLQADVSRQRRKQNIDKLAASVMLQSYLDRRRPSAEADV